MAYLAIATAMQFLLHVETVRNMPLFVLGVACLVGGFAMMMWAWALFNAKKTAICPTSEASTLIEKGPFHFTRNPMYLGMILMLCGISFLMGSFIIFAAPIAFFITVNYVFIPVEEQNMERIFGSRFNEYRQQVRRWL
jgi:protein-S-isoprenylcysteine O-methyltransferase Ste14